MPAEYYVQIKIENTYFAVIHYTIRICNNNIVMFVSGFALFSTTVHAVPVAHSCVKYLLNYWEFCFSAAENFSSNNFLSECIQKKKAFGCNAKV